MSIRGTHEAKEKIIPVTLGLFSLLIFHIIVRFHQYMKGGDFIGKENKVLHEYSWYS